MNIDIYKYGAESVGKESAHELALSYIRQQLKRFGGGEEYFKKYEKSLRWYQWLERKRTLNSITFYRENEKKYRDMLSDYNNGVYKSVIVDMDLFVEAMGNTALVGIVNFNEVETKRILKNVLTALKAPLFDIDS